ncbi:MAG TPA: serine protease [Pirellulaceae bacterium]|nr:serine protease [Pirellulaceae bacterium]
MKRTASCVVFSAIVWSFGLAHAQVGKDTELWQWTSTAEHHNAIVQITCNGGTGTGVIIGVNYDKPVRDGYHGYCLTAWHVVQDDNKKGNVSIVFRNGKKAKNCRVVEHDQAADVAILLVWVPEEIQPARVAQEPVKTGDALEFCGLGGGSELDCCLRHFSGVASMPSTLQKIFADVPLLPGDSGGPVFNNQHEVVGIISGGWFWWDGGVKNSNGAPLNATWPARAANLGPIQTMMAGLENTTTISR